MTSLVNTYRGKRVFVGLSGGVDSAVTAHILRSQGALVTGVFIKGWYPPGMPCTWAEDRRDAMRVAAHLHIPFYTLDASREYKESVIEYLISEYKAGRTPNPDIMCNRDVKFGAFYSFARSRGADFIATGHYAKQERGALLRGVDTSKDQSYFLWAISNEALAHSIFPLGDTQKVDTRAYALRHHLPVASKKDSQGICFLGSISVEDFLVEYVGTKQGIAKDITGKEIGTHSGVLLYTLGEKVPLTNAPAGPWYVQAKDIPRNELTVSHSKYSPQTRENILLREVNLFRPVSSAEPLTAQYRYHGPVIEGTFDETTHTFILSSSVSEPIASGQSLVIYQGNECLGGGIIV